MFTERQINALKYVIAYSKDGNSLVKQMFWLLLDESKLMRKEVCITLIEGEGFSEEEVRDAGYGASGFSSTLGSTQIDQIMIAMGTDFRFSYHYGRYGEDGLDTSGQFAGISEERMLASAEDAKALVKEGVPVAYTFWLARDHYSRTATLVPVVREQLISIDLNKSGLYPDLENQQLEA
tara:strand:- start:3041 stop:3577 length:537 start_codon:yes stop_codon:yes gene_type:complete